MHRAPYFTGITLGPWDASFTTLKEQRQYVLAVPSVEMAKLVLDIGNCSKNDEDLKKSSKWDRFGLDALPAEKVKAPLVGGAHIIANIECVVKDTKMVASYGMWVLKLVKAWINPNMKLGEGGRMFHHRGDGTFVVNGEVLDITF
jgi:flavin reductase (DIM6/NTAB) family NADH-FMN oxidoreductase RutF